MFLVDGGAVVIHPLPPSLNLQAHFFTMLKKEQYPKYDFHVLLDLFGSCMIPYFDFSSIFKVRKGSYVYEMEVQWEATSIRFIVVKRRTGDIILSNRFPNNKPIVYMRDLWI